jgi:hypothetical protein
VKIEIEPGLSSVAKIAAVTVVFIVVTVGLVVGFVVGTVVGVFVGVTVALGVGFVARARVGVGVGVSSTGTVTWGVVGATVAEPVNSASVHPLIKTIPIARRVKIQTAIHFFMNDASDSQSIVPAL